MILQCPYFNRQLQFVISDATAPSKWAVGSEGYINKTNEPTGNGNLQVSHKIKNKQLSAEVTRPAYLTVTVVGLTKQYQYQISTKLVRHFKTEGPESMTII